MGLRALLGLEEKPKPKKKPRKARGLLGNRGRQIDSIVDAAVNGTPQKKTRK